MYKEDLASNNLQWLICHETKPNHQLGGVQTAKKLDDFNSYPFLFLVQIVILTLFKFFVYIYKKKKKNYQKKKSSNVYTYLMVHSKSQAVDENSISFVFSLTSFMFFCLTCLWVYCSTKEKKPNARANPVTYQKSVFHVTHAFVYTK